MEQERSGGASALADLITAVLLVGAGVFIFLEAYNMPRLEARRIEPLTIPGLVPMALAAALVILAAMLAWRSVRTVDRSSWPDLLSILRSREALRAGAAGLAILILSLVMIGRMPFWLASMLFIFGFIILLEVFLSDEPVPLLHSAAWAAVTAIVAGGGIYLLFAQIFLVRLP